MKLERILAILVMILERKVLASELAEKFEVSTRTIYRDMETLLYAGFPVVSLPGKNGGFTMLDTYKLATFTFSEAEKQILLEALEARSEFMLNDSQETLREKITLLQTEKPASNHIFFDSATQHRRQIEAEVKRKIAYIQKAFTTNKQLKISYIAMSGTETEREISPQKLNLMDGSWYLEAYCHKRAAVRHFKVTRITALKEIDKAIMEIAETKYQPGEMERIVLEFPKNQLGKLLDYFLWEEMEIEEDFVRVTFLYDLERQIIPFLLMFGSAVKILEPASLQKDYKAEVEKLYFNLNC
ncbi:YafY family protein [Listeria cossartiae subsp. cayugensis]|uniref:YafY family protein n=1 Tax=Listeria cossartiae subsp. cayugensis TaxID=2713505 RepID=A0A7X0ZEP0_9LIST|nr:YafY family protein [Listeria cossartiae]MBC2250933.1 YafY family transcriptional regulator [Listeria cossartiae subsp. cayugensis]MDT0050613.1 YafY family protein [Listeria cossartiae subsp. cayugensis]MDT0067115.1 YafY family protein [Listeria cossartiae subsp. cayugensis]MDT0080900.1 YafY family protein [Listeria cossartiae subsp. cayugensis]MDT0083565.1 YafY family protein [Listeria cossartiae subsp. cayugensis]